MSQINPQDLYTSARDAATAATVEQYGSDSVPVTPGTEEHSYWLDQFDYHMQVALYGAPLNEVLS